MTRRTPGSILFPYTTLLRSDVKDPLTGTDASSIRKRAHFSLAYDHRLVDGADAARFLAELKALLEDFPEDA